MSAQHQILTVTRLRSPIQKGGTEREGCRGLLSQTHIAVRKGMERRQRKGKKRRTKEEREMEGKKRNRGGGSYLSLL